MRQFSSSDIHEFLIVVDSLGEEYLATDWIPSQALQCP
jgi:hypothetical protein